MPELDLAGFSIAPAPFDETDFPPDDAVMQTIGAVRSDLFALFAVTALEADGEDIAWGFVNLFHRAATRKSASLDRAADEIRALLAAADGSEVHSSNLEEQVERAQAAEASMLAFEQMREVAASLYRDETSTSWKPMSGSKVRAERRRAALTPEGTPVVFAGGQLLHDRRGQDLCRQYPGDARQVREQVPDMLLVHGGDGKGADGLAASWAERREIQQLTFGLDRRLGAWAAFKRNEQMLGLNPRYVVAFRGDGVTERLVIEAEVRRITVLDRRGPLGIKPGGS